MKAPPTPGSLSHTSSYNLNDSLSFNDTYNPPLTPSGQPRNSDNFKGMYNYPDGGEYVGSGVNAASSGFSDNLDGSYQSSHKYVQQSMPSTVNQTPAEPAPTPAPVSNNCNSRASSYVVSIGSCCRIGKFKYTKFKKKFRTESKVPTVKNHSIEIRVR